MGDVGDQSAERDTISTPRRSAAPAIASRRSASDVGLDPAEQDQVALRAGRADGQQRVLRPVDLAGLSLDQADRGPVDLEVVELLRVEPRDDLRVERRSDGLERRAGRAGGVVPAREGADQDGRAKLRRIALPRSQGPWGEPNRNQDESSRRQSGDRSVSRARPSGPAFTIGVWKRRRRFQRRSGAPTIAELRPGQRFEGRFACVRKDRLTARNGGAYLSLELRDRTGTLAGSGVPRGRPHRAALRTRRRGARPGQARALPGRAGRRARRRAPARARARSTRPSSFPPPIARSKSSRASWSICAARSTTPACGRSSNGSSSPGRTPSEFRRAPCTQGGHHAYLGGLIEHTVAVGTLVVRDVPAPSHASTPTS